MVVFTLGVLVGIIWLFIKLVLYIFEVCRMKRQSAHMATFADTTSAPDTAERDALKERINRLYVQLNLLQDISATLDDTPTNDPQKALKARLTNEKQIDAILTKIQKLEKELGRL